MATSRWPRGITTRRENKITNEQKEAITRLRLDGWGYDRISKRLEIKENTVKSFCRRHGLKKGRLGCSVRVGGSQEEADETLLQKLRRGGRPVPRTEGEEVLLRPLQECMVERPYRRR